MKRYLGLIIAIISILVLGSACFAWMLQTQEGQIEQDKQAAAACITEQITEAASAIPPAVSQAEEKTAANLAAEHIYAHRGSSGASMEHSFPQYDEAIRQGARNIEQDIVISRDGTLYVSHDRNPGRLTGTARAFADMSDAEIDQLRTHAGEKILRLSEVFDRYGTKINYVVELKSANQRMIDAFTTLVDQYGFQDRIIVQCFDVETLRILEDRFPDMPKMYLCEVPALLEQGYQADYVDIISAELSMMTQANVDRAHADGKQFCAWTLLSEDQIRRAIDLDVDGYFTDEVWLALGIEKEYGFEKRYVKQRKTGKKPETRKAGELETTIFFASDYQIVEGWDTPKENLAGILDAVSEDGKTPETIIYCGDYTNDRNLHDYQLSPEDSIAEIRETVQAEFPETDQEDMLFVQGNHDQLTGSIASSGLHEYEDFLVYVLNTENDFPWKQGKEAGCLKKVTRASKEMKACFDKLIKEGESRPVFIAGHVPLHFTARTSTRHSTGDNLYASLIFDVVNEAGRSLDIVYLFGHNHSKGWDCYMGGGSVYRAKGDHVLIPAFAAKDVSTDRYTEETLNFTYLNAGYTGYIMNCGPEELDAGTADQYHAADETLTGTVCEIYPEKMVMTRFAADGVHQLGADGEADPYKDHIDTGLIDPKDYGKRTESPQIIDRTQ